MQSLKDGKRVTNYFRYGDSSGREPLILLQEHYGIKLTMLPQVSEEFRLFHNLWQSSDGSELVQIGMDGSDDTVGRISHEKVEIRTPLLRQFQAARHLDLILFVDSFRIVSRADDGECDLPLNDEDILGNDRNFAFDAGYDPLDRRFYSRFCGKRILAPPPIEKSGVWPWEHRSERFPEFIIGEDEHGSEVRRSCDPGLIDDDYLRPVFFRRSVLQRYYDEPEKYFVEDGYLQCGGLWGMTIDNDNPDHVGAFLGDLGRDLPESDRYHWHAHNVAPSTLLSETAIRRNLLNQLVAARSPDLQFASLYERFNNAWERQCGWRLYREPHDADSHIVRRLRVPLNDSLPEFEAQIAGLTKCLIDFLDEKGIAAQIGGARDGEKGIDKFERWLHEAGYPQTERDVAFLRRLQRLRSRSVAHAKGSDHELFLKKENVDDDRRAEVVRQLSDGAEMLRDVARHFDVAL